MHLHTLSMQTVWVLIGLFTILVTNVAAQSCSANLNPKAQIVLVTDRMVPLDVLGVSAVDTNLTFFREVLEYDDDKIQQETENALQFFNERFGLDFSLSPPNELGLRFFQNAILQPIRRSGGVSATFNRWFLTGNTWLRCFNAVRGGYFVNFTGEHLLKGTYGGEEGIEVTSSRSLQYDHLSISTACQDPVVIQRRTPIPNETSRFGFFVLFYELSHPMLGQGSQQGFFQTELANGTDILCLSGSAVLTFPPNAYGFN